MQPLNLLDYRFKILNQNDILELIKKNSQSKRRFAQIISLNPENIMAMKRSPEFAKVVLTSYGQIADGVGVVLAAKLLAGTTLPRLTGVKMTDRLLSMANDYSLRCLLIGGRGKLADMLAKCYKDRYPGLIIAATEGFGDINSPTETEKMALKQIVSSTRPHLVFVSFGSPAQEMWIDKNKDLFSGCLVMGVGGAFSMLSGAVRRSPVWMSRWGLEWFYRLVSEPWRLKRQLKLVDFAVLVIRKKFGI